MKVDNIDGFKNYGQYRADQVRQNDKVKSGSDGAAPTTEETTAVAPESTAVAATYEHSTDTAMKAATYQVDWKEIARMKAETDSKMVETLKVMVKSQFKGQMTVAENGDTTISGAFELTIKLKYKAKEGQQDAGQVNDETSGSDTTESGVPKGLDPYWSAEQTSDRMLKFAKSLSGDNKEKAELLKNAFLEGYKQAKEAFGGTLPQVSEDTYKLTVEKFDKWMKGEEEVE